MADPLTTSAISWGFSAASWLISPALTRFLNKCFDALGIDPYPQFQSRKQILLQKLENLQTTLLPQLLILTDAAQQSSHRPGLNKLLQELKSAFYETEHVLGLVEYQRLEKEVNSLFPSTSRFNLKVKLPKFSSEKKNLIKSLENLEKIVNEAMKFVTLLNLPSSNGNNSTRSSNDQYRETVSTPGSTVIGRDEDRNNIVNMLRENVSESTGNADSYSVIGIWGMGGSGKTTLAQYVCEHEKAAKYFDCILWAHVSEKFSVHGIFKKILESTKEACPDISSVEGLKSKLEDKLTGQMFFLVLDDVWCDKGVSEQELNQLFAPLRAGKQGSKILVTTRNEEAARALGAMDPMKLPELADKAFLSLFMSHALRDVNINEHLKGRLRAIGEKIVEKLCRLPLAAATVAGQLRRNLDPEFWSSMLNKNLLNDTMGSLFLSYQHLPTPLQRCFTFCSLFPKGHQFEHDHLVNLWIAEGFIETENSNEHMLDIANRYILQLVSSSFFQIVERNSKLYSMHNLMHDLAQYASGGEYFRIESGEKKEIPNHTRHIFVVDHILGEYVDKICELEDLRTIIVDKSYSNVSLKESDLDALFTKLRKLYVVEIEGPCVIKVSKSVVNLKNLRYLKVVDVDRVKSLNRLYQLRTLCINCQIPDVGRLILLQDLKEFHVRMKRGFELKQLEHLKDLSGSLSISGLKNVESKEEAYRAKLSDKKSLHKLLFSWDYQNRDILRDIDVEILDGLCPPPKIKQLTIKGYSGKRFPSWILENNDNIIHLQHLELTNCGGLEALHRLNELSDLLSLDISFLPRLKSWVPLPLNLNRLRISHCLSLAFLLKEDLEMILSTKGTRILQIVTFLENPRYGHFPFDFLFKHVQELMKLGDRKEEKVLSTISKDLKKCLEKMLDLICQLKNVNDKLFLPITLHELSIETFFITDKILVGSLQGLTFLTHLRLVNIITITCIPKKVLSSLTNLLNLYIKGCLLLTLICGLDTHNTLEQLQIWCCPSLTFGTSLVVASSSEAVELESSSCKRKTRSSILNFVILEGCMPSDNMLDSLVSLENLNVWDCPTLVNPHIGHLKALSVLRLLDCRNLASLRGLSELNNLERLEVLFNCEELKCYSDADKLPPQLQELCISRWSLLEQLVSRDGFSSLFTLELYGLQQEYFSQEECEVFRYLSSLGIIRFDRCKIHSLPNLSHLHSLRYLDIRHCKNLSSLSEVPQSVVDITIYCCNYGFTRSCKDQNHPNWHKISHIPSKYIWQ